MSSFVTKALAMFIAILSKLLVALTNLINSQPKTV